MAFYDAFFGSDQSLYTAYAIMAAIIAICITILLTATDISVGNRILIVLFVVITLVPSIFLTLFEITCMVTGGTEPNRWWCYAFAWILAAFVIIYCVFVVIISLISLFTYNNAIDNVNEAEKKNKLSDTDTNHIAKEIIKSDEEKKNIENFYGMPDETDQFRNYATTYNIPGPDMVGDARNARKLAEYNASRRRSKFENREDFGAEPMDEQFRNYGTTYNIPGPDMVGDARNARKLAEYNASRRRSKFENREDFGAEPMDELQPAPVPLPPMVKDKNENFLNNNESFTNTEGFESYNDDKKNYFSDFSPSGVANSLHDIKNSIPFPSFGNLM